MPGNQALWIGDDAESSLADLFGLSAQEREEVRVAFDCLFARYDLDGYDGSALVILRSKADGSLFEVNGSHCSCNGLEGQWELEGTTFEALRVRQGSGIDFSALIASHEESQLREELPEGKPLRARKAAL